MFTVVILFVVLFGAANSQVVYTGDCPNVTAIHDFNITAYLGIWHEYEKYFDSNESGTKCNFEICTLASDGSTMDVVKKAIYSCNGTTVESNGTITVVNSTTGGTVELTFDGNSAVYYILGTDYENYSSVFYCVQNGSTNSRYAWILTRKRRPSFTYKAIAEELFREQGISVTPFIITTQVGCD